MDDSSPVNASANDISAEPDGERKPRLIMIYDDFANCRDKEFSFEHE
jgi:hypothetical protein